MCKNNMIISDTSPSVNTSSKETFPVVIAGAGPCGLVAARNLQKNGIPFVVFERASREKLCSNAGSGIDMAPSAFKILENELGIDMDKAMRPYEYMYITDMKGKKIKTYAFQEVIPDREFGFSNRSDLQNALLDSLSQGEGTSEEESSYLKCGVAVSSYSNEEDHVLISLSDGSTVKGSALLACDGIHSAIRKHMHNDELNYCGQICWWGKTIIKEGTELEKELKEIEKSMTGSVAISIIGDHDHPGIFFSVPVADNMHAWAYVMEQKESPTANQTNDLVRRGGAILTEELKRHELEELITDRSKLLRLIIQETPAPDITRAAFFDRKNLDLAFVDGRVALLGDAAHPQSPMMGQGANMAIVDAYVATTRISSSKMENIIKALAEYDSDIRRQGINKVIADARFYGDFTASSNRFKCWLTKLYIKYMPSSAVMADMLKGDETNKMFMDSMYSDLAQIATCDS